MKFKDTHYGDLTNKEYSAIRIRYSNLTSLEGSPKEINGKFNCSYNELTSLDFSPQIVRGDFNCSNNKLTSLKGSPQIVKGDFFCSYNNLLTLEGCAKTIEGEFICINNKELKQIKNQVIKYGIKAEKYFTDEGDFSFEEIKKQFEKFSNYLLKKEITKKQIIKKNKAIDFGLGI